MGRRLTDREKLFFKLDSFTDGEVSELLDYVSIMESMKREISQPDIFEDELLNLLSSARENQREQQVFEWETARRRAESRSSPLAARR